jgi:Family of unknown function (DUF6502)
MSVPPSPRNTRTSIRDAALAALKQILDPLIDLMLVGGISVQEMGQIVRICAVDNAGRRVRGDTGRNSYSRVSIITGLPRSEVARLMKTGSTISQHSNYNQHRAQRVLSAWYDEPRYLNKDGDPDALPIFGKRRSFESLVRRSSGGIPVRAMLDELIRVDAVQLLPNQRLRPKSRVPIQRGLTPEAISAIGERGRDLLKTLTRNLKQSQPFFEATSSTINIDLNSTAFLRREVNAQGTNFINGIGGLLNSLRLNNSMDKLKASDRCRVGVTIYYFQDESLNKSESSAARRKNLQRRRGFRTPKS